MPGSAGMAMLVVLFVQLFRGMTCSRRTLHMKCALEVLADKGFFCLVFILEYAGKFGLLYKWWIWFVVAAGV